MFDKYEFVNRQFYHYQFILPLKKHSIDNAGMYGMLSYNISSVIFSLPSPSNMFEPDCQFP